MHKIRRKTNSVLASYTFQLFTFLSVLFENSSGYDNKFPQPKSTPLY